jgi:hypothetical protein
MRALSRTVDRLRIHALLRRLRAEKAFPSSIEIGTLGNDCIATLLDSDHAAIVSEQACTGLASSEERALIKALAEYIERRAVAGPDGAPSSSGFAAFPLAYNSAQNASRRARANAFHEALERYVWASWWDTPKFRHTVSVLKASEHPELRGFDDLIRSILPIDRYLRIVPDVSGLGDSEVLIVFAFLSGGGVISGGAAGFARRPETTRYRAFSELARHALGLRRSQESGAPTPSSLYDRRLVYFGSGKGDEVVRARLDTPGDWGIELPDLVVDRRISHAFQDIVVVHRCEFAGQPPFVGGAMERLCL